ncbi:S-adenosyl-L-methionine-dependent methyltransferase [Artomyces pyxidatus]|uniref:S-adenosyl-L-methionine-dependent methyltransferase n=1 Tax=Artomyces pyxidatus TaxID=48021 RepID=A0ACB8SW37_9AGAM|nr:S-adenosyl-L-methionine-dependent methyltransferase [Artomyces pyxidatus]
MSLRLPATALNVSDVGSDNDSESTGDEAEETWSDWVSDSEDRLPCTSLFEDKTLSSTAEALAYDKKIHNFDLTSVCKQLALDFHKRVRLINYIRKERPTAASLQSLTGTEPFFSSDDYLVPVIEDDPLLVDTSDDWSDSDDDSAPAPTDLAGASRRIATLEGKLEQAKKDLIDYKRLVSERLNLATLKAAIETSDASTSAPARDDDSHYFDSYGANDIHAVMIQDKVRTSTYASFIMTNPSLFRDAIVLDVGCGTGILSLFAARAGAKRVIAVDASDIAQKAMTIVKANGLEEVITVIQGKVEHITLPDDITKVDIIVSEWMGYGLLYESMLDSVLHARDLFLKPDGVMAPSQCRMMLGLCDAVDIYKERIGFWNDIYGFDLSAMADEVYNDAIVDVVGPDTMLSDAYTIKDLYIRDITSKHLDFTAPFTLVSTATRRSKVHALLLYFDTFFSPSGDPIPESTEVQITKDGSGALAEVWQLGRQPHNPRRQSQSAKDKAQITSFSTGPLSVPTHWKHTIFLLRDPIVVEEGTVVAGTFHCRKSEDNSRELDVEVHYSVRESLDADAPADLLVQIYKVR